MKIIIFTLLMRVWKGAESCFVGIVFEKGVLLGGKKGWKVASCHHFFLFCCNQRLTVGGHC